MNKLKKNLITNPVYKILKNLKLVKSSNLEICSNYVRDSKEKNNVYYDKKNHFYFLQKSIYSKKNNFDKLFSDNPSNKKFVLNNKKQSLRLNIIDDDNRRFEQFKKMLENKFILDFGAGYGDFISKFNIKKVAAVEKRKKCLDYLKNKNINVFSDLKDVDRKYDIVTLFNSLDHLEKPDQAIYQIRKILKKNGKLIIEVPNSKNILLNSKINEYKIHTFCKKHLIIFSEKILLKLLENTGFKIKKVIYFQRYNFNNHLYWYLFKKPNGHNEFKNLKINKLNQIYEKFLIDSRQTDTIIVIAQKND